MTYDVPTGTSDTYWNGMIESNLEKEREKTCVRAFANSYYDHQSGILKYSSTDSYCCTMGITATTMHCPYTDSTDYKWFMYVWCIIWVWVICFRIFYNIGYDTNDLRYYLSLERCKTHWVTRFNFLLILGLSFYSAIFVFDKINDRMPYQLRLERRMSTIIALAVNLSTAVPLISTSYPDLKEIDMRKDFPERVELRHGFIAPTAFNLYGAVLTAHQVFSSIEKAIVHGFIHDDDTEIETIGPAESIKLLMSCMTGHIYKNAQSTQKHDKSHP